MTVTGTHLSQPRPEAAAVKARQEDAMVEHAGAQLRFLPPYREMDPGNWTVR